MRDTLYYQDKNNRFYVYHRREVNNRIEQQFKCSIEYGDDRIYILDGLKSNFEMINISNTEDYPLTSEWYVL